MIRLAVLMLVVTVQTAGAATFYVGAFDGSTPLDDADCGTGLGAAPDPHPCATLAYWTQQRRPAALTAGDTVRLTGTFGPEASAHHCIIPTTGVTYEGRTAADEEPTSWGGAFIDAALTPGGGGTPCKAGALTCAGVNPCQTVSDFTVRYLTFRNAPGAAPEGSRLQPRVGLTMDGITLDTVRFTGANSAGLIIGNGIDHSEDSWCNGTWETTNVTVRNSQFDRNVRNETGKAGLQLACVDGALVEDVAAFDNVPLACDPAAPDCSQEGPCDNADGIQPGGSKNVTFRRVTAYRNAEDNFDCCGLGSEVCDVGDVNILVEQSEFHDAVCGSNLSFSHCAGDVTVRNSFAWGDGRGINQKACAHHLRFYNNTVWMDDKRALMFFDDCLGCEVRNNILSSDTADGDAVVFVDRASTAPDVLWEGNVVEQRGAGDAVKDVCTTPSTCDGPGFSFCNPPSRTEGACSTSSFACCDDSGCPDGETCEDADCDPQHPGHMPGWWTTAATAPLDDTQLATFRADGALGAWFGDESGVTDTWNATPAFVDESSPSGANLHLEQTDAVAKDAGVAIAAVPADFDGQPRPGLEGRPWDVGADEIPPCVTPLAGCRTPVVPFRARLSIKNKDPDSRDKLSWNWTKGQATSPAELGSPTTDDAYALCLYDESSATPALLLQATAPAGGTCPTRPCWKGVGNPPGSKGAKYKDRELAPDGLQKIRLKPGNDGSARIFIAGRGEQLGLPPGPVPLPLRVQLRGTHGVCWEARYGTALKNDGVTFEARAD